MRGLPCYSTEVARGPTPCLQCRSTRSTSVMGWWPGCRACGWLVAVFARRAAPHRGTENVGGGRGWDDRGVQDGAAGGEQRLLARPRAEHLELRDPQSLDGILRASREHARRRASPRAREAPCDAGVAVRWPGGVREGDRPVAAERTGDGRRLPKSNATYLCSTNFHIRRRAHSPAASSPAHTKEGHGGDRVRRSSPVGAGAPPGTPAATKRRVKLGDRVRAHRGVPVRHLVRLPRQLEASRSSAGAATIGGGHGGDDAGALGHAGARAPAGAAVAWEWCVDALARALCAPPPCGPTPRGLPLCSTGGAGADAGNGPGRRTPRILQPPTGREGEIEGMSPPRKGAAEPA